MKKSIFTYPDNLGTNYIDPDYYGDFTNGVSKRIADLMGGTYKTWQGASPNYPTDYANVVQAVSKYNNATPLEEASGVNTIYKLWQQPIVEGELELIESNISSGVYGSLTGLNADAEFNFSGDHGFYTGQKMLASGFNGSGAFLNGNEYYVGKEAPDTIKLYTDEARTLPVKFYNLENADISTATMANPVVFTDTEHDLSTGTLVTLDNTDGTLADYNGLEFYAKVIDSSTFKLTWDAAGTNEFGIVAEQNLTIDNYILEDSPEGITIELTTASPDLVDGSKASFDAPGAPAYDDFTVLQTIAESDDGFPDNLAMSKDGKTVAVRYDSDVRVYQYSAGTYALQQTISSIGTDTRDDEVALSDDGNTLVIGNHNDLWDTGSQQSGAVYVYTRSGSTWTQSAKLGEDDRYLGRFLGKYLAISGDGNYVASSGIAIAGSPNVAPIYVWYNNAGTWQLQASLTHNTTSTFWPKVALDDQGELLVIAQDSSTNHILFYTRSGSTWTLDQSISAGFAGEVKDIALNRTGEYLALGLPTENSDDGEVEIYNYSTNWSLQTTLTITGGGTSPEFGYSVAFDTNANTLAVGALNNEDASQAEPHGAVYMFSRSGSTWTEEQTILKVPERFSDREFGKYVALSNNAEVLAIGDPVDGSSGGTGNLTIYQSNAAYPIQYYLSEQSDLYLKTTTTDKYEIYTDPGLTTLLQWQDDVISASGTITGNSYTGDFGNTTVAPTTGDVVEVYTPPTANIYANEDIFNSTAGTLTIAESVQNRYRLSSLNLLLPGNTTYMQRTGASTYVNNARIVEGSYWLPNATSTDSSYSRWPVTTITTNSSGYPTSISFDTEFPGSFLSISDRLFEIETVPDTYTPPALTIAEQEEIFDTEDEWLDTGFDDGKEWPDTVIPATANLIYDQPSATAVSQNGQKFVRGSGYTRWQLEVTYPPMTSDQFREYHSVAQKARGQYIPFFFNIRKGQTPWLLTWQNTNISNSTDVRYKESYSAGDAVVLLEGVHENDRVDEGQIVIIPDENGSIKTIVNTAEPNAYGEVKVRLAYALDLGKSAGQEVYFNPYHMVVTLAENGFEYSIDTAGFYYVSVTFDLDQWK